MFLGFDITSLVDAGFVAFVTIAASYSLLGKSAGPEQRSGRWKRELHELEFLLRELVKEATAASSNLDRSLAQRKVELERLLEQIEDQSNAIALEHGTQQSATAQSTAQSAIPDDELPNPSWEEPRRKTTPAKALKQYGRSGVPTRPKRTPVLDRETPQPEDQVTLTSKSAAAGSPPRSLSAQVEVAAAHEHYVSTEDARGPGILDAVTYKVARRLLSSGKEIHVVARKLELPLADVRLLDKIIRREAGIADAPETALADDEIATAESFESITLTEPAPQEDAVGITREQQLL